MFFFDDASRADMAPLHAIAHASIERARLIDIGRRLGECRGLWCAACGRAAVGVYDRAAQAVVCATWANGCGRPL